MQPCNSKYVMVDCATVLTPVTAKALADAGVQVVGRYLWSGGKGATPDEVPAIHGAGMGIFLFYEATPTHADYFSHDQGTHDGQNARQFAQTLGVPTGIAICATTDYDAQPSDMPAIYDYFCAFADAVNGYTPDMYGSFAVMEYLAAQPRKPDGAVQTYAWSGENLSSEADIYQYCNSQNIGGVEVDVDKVFNDPGIWWPASHTQNQQTVDDTPILVELREGANGSLVKILQERIGMPIDEQDGAFGGITFDAVHAWQSAHGLLPDGVVGPKTWGALLPLLKQGSTGLFVRILQKSIGGLKVDGDFGPITDGAVRRFQSEHGLKADGEVGRLTWGQIVV